MKNDKLKTEKIKWYKKRKRRKEAKVSSIGNKEKRSRNNIINSMLKNLILDNVVKAQDFRHHLTAIYCTDMSAFASPFFNMKHSKIEHNEDWKKEDVKVVCIKL